MTSVQKDRYNYSEKKAIKVLYLWYNANTTTKSKRGYYITNYKARQKLSQCIPSAQNKKEYLTALFFIVVFSFF